MAISDSYSRSAIAQLITDSKLYTKSQDYKDLLDFVGRLRNFAPFNAMLLQIQKPGLSYAASARDWRVRFGRKPKEGARPLLVLKHFGPVDLVYDVVDTEGRCLPKDVVSFPTTGFVSQNRLNTFQKILERNHIEWLEVDAGDNRAGSIRFIRHVLEGEKEYAVYRIHINRNHPPPTQFATMLHELAHLLLGHLGEDKNFRAPAKHLLSHRQAELEAESVSYLVCKRNGIESKSEKYLSEYVGKYTTIEDIDIYLVLRVVQDIEKLLKLSPST